MKPKLIATINWLIRFRPDRKPVLMRQGIARRKCEFSIALAISIVFVFLIFSKGILPAKAYSQNNSQFSMVVSVSENIQMPGKDAFNPAGNSELKNDLMVSQEDNDPVQGLHTFMERQGVKPYDLFQRGNELMTQRLIFHDRQFGTQVWMLDNSPVVDHCATASIWQAWNGNASGIYVGGARMINDTTHQGWFFNSDFSRLLPARGGHPAVWAPENPDVYYAPHSPASHITRNNWRTGEQHIVTEWEPLTWEASGQRIYGITRDSRYIFVDLPNRGIFVPFLRDEKYPVPELPLYDGRPIGPGGQSIGHNRMNAILNHAEYGDLIGLRTGMLVDRQTGERINIVAPLCGNTNYLRAFHDGRVKYPRGEEWNAYGLPWFVDEVRLPTGLSMEELYDLWLNLPHVTHGHESPSPDWKYMAVDGGATRIFRVSDGEVRSFRLSSDGGNYHLQWRKHPRFFVGWVRGWSFGRYTRPQNANIEFQIFSDATFQPIVDTKHRFNGYYLGGDFSMFSPDATKIHYGSNMTGRFRNYIAVMARPRPPRNLSWEADGSAVKLSWKPSLYHKETKGYLVYRSDVSGDGYKLLTPKPVTETTWRDENVERGKAYYFVVTSLENSGLESGYSEELARAGVRLPGRIKDPLVVYVECEGAIRDIPTDVFPGLSIGRDVNGASDWYFLYRHPESEKGQSSVLANIPADEEYTVWARIRCGKEKPAGWRFNMNGETLEVSSQSDQWNWVRAGRVNLKAGKLEIDLSTRDKGAELDMLCLASDDKFRPAGIRPENSQPPASPKGLQVQNVRERTNHLRWETLNDPRLSHYNVYASRQPFSRPVQEYLVGSPVVPELIDWGLRAGTRYYYAVTAVDRQNNESKPVFIEAVTPARKFSEVNLELAFADAEAQGRFERSVAGGLRGKAYLVPEETNVNEVKWEVNIPGEGEYFLWLRYLQRGSGQRGQQITQDIDVFLNGRKISVLAPGQSDLNIPDELIREGNPQADRFWTWAQPGPAVSVNPVPVRIPSGRHTLVLKNLHESVRYDVLLITDEPAFRPEDGRLRQNH